MNSCLRQSLRKNEITSDHLPLKEKIIQNHEKYTCSDWEHIRANKGSGKKPTAEMLKQEKKIKLEEKK